MPYVYPEFIAGPFSSLGTAAWYSDQVVVGRRGLQSKVRHACELAHSLDVPCYHIQCQPPEGVRAYLERAGAPPSYLQVLAELEAAAARLADGLVS